MTNAKNEERHPTKKQSFFSEKDCFFVGYLSLFLAIHCMLRLYATPNQSLTIYLFVEWGPLKVLDNTELILNESQFGII